MNRVFDALRVALVAGALITVGTVDARDASSPIHDFRIDNGLVKRTLLTPASAPVSEPASEQADYHAKLPDAAAPGGMRRFELHWLPVPGKTITRPALWEPAVRCLTPLHDAARIDAGNWTFAVDDVAALTPNGNCQPGRRYGGLAGVGSVHVILETRGEQVSYSVGIAVKTDPGKAMPPMLIGHLQPSKAIATRQQVGRFEEKFLFTESFRSLEGIWLATTYGLFRGTDRAPRTGRPGFVVVETTDLYRSFRPGDLFMKVERDLSMPLRLTLVQQGRIGDGSHCPDIDDGRDSFNLNLVSLRNGVRTWYGNRTNPAQRERYCVSEEVNRRTCKVVRCLQWSESLNNEAWSQRIELFTDNEAHARKLLAGLPPLTLATAGVRHDPLAWQGRTGRSGRDPTARCGGIGQEDCAAQRRREDIEQFLIDQWNR